MQIPSSRPCVADAGHVCFRCFPAFDKAQVDRVLGHLESTVEQKARGETLEDPRLRRMIAGKLPKPVAVALAGRMARMIRALSVKNEDHRAPAAMAAAA